MSITNLEILERPCDYVTRSIQAARTHAVGQWLLRMACWY